jgi:hypothetical protein
VTDTSQWYMSTTSNMQLIVAQLTKYYLLYRNPRSITVFTKARHCILFKRIKPTVSHQRLVPSGVFFLEVHNKKKSTNVLFLPSLPDAMPLILRLRDEVKIITHTFSNWSRVFEKLIVGQVIKKFSLFTVFARAPLDPIQGDMSRNYSFIWQYFNL